MKILDYLKENILVLDGGTGTLLQSAGLPIGELPERWNISHPEAIKDIHKSYFDAGSNIVCTNTFGANSLKYGADELRQIIVSAVKNARDGLSESCGTQPKWVALDIGPLGRMLRPLGDLDFEDAVSIFSETVKIGARCGIDLIFIETMADSYETKAALLAAKENSNLPIFVSNAYGEDGKLMTGANPSAVVALLEGMGADAIGVNCSLGPDKLIPIVDEYLKYASVPVIVKPNAGLPSVVDGRTVYDLTPNQFAESIHAMIEQGATIVGGCCGTTPEYISAINKDFTPKTREKKNIKLVSSYTHAVEFCDSTILIGERINPTGKPRFREALRSGDMEYILREAVGQEAAGAHVLDVNVGIPDIDEAALLTEAVCRIQAICDLPLQIDSSNPSAMERALRYYNGKAMINSVNGKAESMAAVFPLAKKYGGVIVCLTLDENGIPERAEDRLEIAKKICKEAEKHGIDKKDLIFDPLAMAVSADKNAARETLRAVKMIHDELGCHTSLGVSNVSFGLPNRDTINATYFTMARDMGLSAAIINPHSEALMSAYRSYNALSGLDDGFKSYIASVTEAQAVQDSKDMDLGSAIVKGLSDLARSLTKEALKVNKPLEVINGMIIPALDKVGEGFERKTIYLPGLLMAAEAAGAAFDVAKSSMPKDSSVMKSRVLLATVKGDIHDIGKNILKLILENYGYDVIDLGKDVSPEKIVETAIEKSCDIVGISALMTTTLPAMEETVSLLKTSMPSCKIMVGGAVLTEDYANKIGADFYGKDAMEAVRWLENINNS